MVDMKDAQYPLVANVTARPVTQTEIDELLVKQVRSPSYGKQSIEWLVASGVDTFMGIGSRKGAGRTDSKNRARFGKSYRRP